MAAIADNLVRLAVATPCFAGQVTQLYLGSLLGLQAACIQRGLVMDVMLNGGDAMITRSRAGLVTQFLQSAATHLLFIDADIGFQPEAVFRLLSAPGPVSGAMYPAKFLDWDRAGQYAREGRPAQDGASHLVGGVGDKVGVETQDGFARADVLGGGFMMIRRDALTLLEDRFPDLRYRSVNTTPDPHFGSQHRYAFFDPIIDENGTYLPEDYSFCRRWRRIGGQIWVDTQTRLAHQGVYVFTSPTA